MDAHSTHASGLLESRTRLRCRTSHEASVNSLDPAAGEKVQGGDAGKGPSNMKMHLLGDALYVDAANPPTSPAFMRILSQRSPSHSSRSPSVASQISSRRRVASPKVAAGAWLSSDEETPSNSASKNRTDASKSASEARAAKPDAPKSKDYTVLSRARGRSCRREGRDAFKDTKRRSSSRHSQKSHRKESAKEENSRSKKHEEGAQLRPVEGPRTPPSRSPSKTPQLVMSPRRFPPPTFEKILLGLRDEDFVVGGEEPDVFGSGTAVPRRHWPVEQKDDCALISVEPERPSRVHASTVDSISSHESVESPVKVHSQNSQEGVIPEHYLYIPPLRAVASREKRRPVPGLHQASDEEGQISVRGERRHIATLFSLDAAESHAQKTRLEEQLKATSPFRLAESSEASRAGGETLDCPPGKSKRRQPSKVLETIVRAHDWRLPELVTETEEQAAQGQPTLREEQRLVPSDEVEASAALESELQWDQFEKNDNLSPVSGSFHEKKETELIGFSGNESESDNVDDRCSQGSSPDETAEIPGAFDAVWGRSDSKKTFRDKESEAASLDDEDKQHTSGQSTPNRMADFLSIQPAFPKTGEAQDDLDELSDAAYEEALSNSSKSDAGFQRASSPTSSVALDEKSGGVALLRLGDPAEWEVRYSTADGFLSSADHSPMHCEVNLSAPTESKEATSGEVRDDSEEDEEEESSNQLLAEPLIPTGCSRDISGGHTRMSSHISRFSSEELYDTARDPSGLHVNAASKATLQITDEPRLGAALDLRLVSVQSFQGEAPVNCNIRTWDATLPSSGARRSAVRKRPRILTDETTLTGCDANSASLEKQVYEGQTDASIRTANASFVSTLTGGAEACSPSDSRSAVPHQNGAQSHASAGTNVTAANDPARVGTLSSLRKAGRTGPSILDRFQPVTTSAGCDAWAEEDTASLHAEDEGASNGKQTDRRGSESLCEIDLSEPLKLSEKETSPGGRSPPSPSRSMELLRLISGSTSWCAYSPSVHAVIVGTMLLALWIVLAILYLFDGNHGLRLFVVCAVALSFVVSLCLGAIHMTSALFTWRALKYALDSDMRELLFSSLKRLRPAPDARDPSVEGLRERGRHLGLACDHFIELITQASPSLEVTRMIGMRFLVAHCFVGLVGGGLIAILGCSIESEASLVMTQLRLGDAVATGAAALYSVLLLVLSYWLATAPTAAAVQRAVERHAAFQYLWSLTFADFLVENGAVTAKSAEALWIHRQEDSTTKRPYLISLKNSLLEQDKSLLTLRVHEIPSSLKTNYMTARTVWQLPSGTASNKCKALHSGKRALLALGSAAPQFTKSSKGERARLSLRLLWWGSGIGPEEVYLPIDFDSLICESTVLGRIPTCRGSSALAHGSGTVGAQSPLEVIRLLLGLLEGDAGRSFMKSQTRRYLSESIPLSATSFESSVILRIPLDSVRPTYSSSCGPPRKSKKTGARTLHSKSQQIHLQGQEGSLAPPAAATGAAIHQEVVTKASIDGVSNAKVGPWVVQSLSLAQPASNAEPLEGKRRLNGPVAAADAASTSEVGSCGRRGACEDFAFLTLLFSSEEQREEFQGCLEQLLCV